jgi:hypothetical protein
MTRRLSLARDISGTSSSAVALSTSEFVASMTTVSDEVFVGVASPSGIFSGSTEVVIEVLRDSIALEVSDAVVGNALRIPLFYTVSCMAPFLIPWRKYARVRPINLEFDLSRTSDRISAAAVPKSWTKFRPLRLFRLKLRYRRR